MRLKFKYRNNIYIKTIIFSIILLTLIFIYFKYCINNVNTIVTNEIINKYENKSTFKIFSKTKILYSFLPKTIKLIENEEVLDVHEIDENNYSDIPINFEKPLVYIYNSHQSEGYGYKDNLYTIKPTVYYASFILKDFLNDLGIESIVETKSIKDYLNKHNLDYTGCYDASREYIKNTIKEYASINYLIDIHRDSTKLNGTLYLKDNKRYARIMFVVGMKHNEYEKNLEFVNSLNNKLNERYNGISRGIYKRKDVIFNQDLREKAILIELGGVDNNIEEINNTLEIIAEILYEDINGTK